mgnify:CR=1 FL=1
MRNNNSRMKDKIGKDAGFDSIGSYPMDVNLSKFLDKMRSPLAIRSSSLLEDSQYQPLSGMYATYMLPNSNRSKTKRLKELIKAIKLVYASTYLKEPSSLIEKSVHRHEEEKMAVIIMAVSYTHLTLPTKRIV